MYLPNMANTPAVNNPKKITATIVTTMIIVTSLLPVSLGSLVSVLVMDVVSSLDVVSLLDGVVTATVTTSELVDEIISVVVFAVDRKT